MRLHIRRRHQCLSALKLFFGLDNRLWGKVDRKTSGKQSADHLAVSTKRAKLVEIFLAQEKGSGTKSRNGPEGGFALLVPDPFSGALFRPRQTQLI